MPHVEKLRTLMFAIAQHPSVENLGVSKLWSLVYSVEVAALRELGASITGSKFFKYARGPVPGHGEELLRSMQCDRELRIVQRRDADGLQPLVSTLVTVPDVLSEAERTVIERTCRALGGKSEQDLSQLIGEEPAWVMATEAGMLDPELLHYGRSVDPEGL